MTTSPDDSAPSYEVQALRMLRKARRSGDDDATFAPDAANLLAAANVYATLELAKAIKRGESPAPDA
jgi:hypothetical protein